MTKWMVVICGIEGPPGLPECCMSMINDQLLMMNDELVVSVVSERR